MIRAARFDHRAATFVLGIVLVAGCQALPPSVMPSVAPSVAPSVMPSGASVVPGSPTPAPSPAPTGTGVAVAPLDLRGTFWVVRTIDGQPVVAASPPTIDFGVGSIRGSTGCNSFEGTLQVDPVDGQLRIGMVSLTERACLAAQGTGDVMAVEKRFAAALPTVRRATFDPIGRLVLDGGGIAIVLEPRT